MLEESHMDKKPGRTVQSALRTNGQDFKVKQDAHPTNAKFPSHPKPRRDVWHNRPDVSRRPVAQKSKAFDKRPQPRGRYMDKDSGQVEDPGDFERYSVYNSGSKKQNLTQLLNFHLTPRGDTTYYKGAKKTTLKYNKERFLQANCQFVVLDGEDYRKHTLDPDLLVDWEKIAQIRLIDCEVASCPICLYPPVAAKMTRCGHVFCWPCMLHYLSLSDKTWRKCPICYEPVEKHELKRVKSLAHEKFTVGHEITMTLMRRERGSLVAVPAANYKPELEGTHLYVDDNSENLRFSKLVLSSKEQVKSHILQEERSELEIHLKENVNEPEACFIEEALLLLEKIEQNYKSEDLSPDVISPSPQVFTPDPQIPGLSYVITDTEPQEESSSDSPTNELTKPTATVEENDEIVEKSPCNSAQPVTPNPAPTHTGTKPKTTFYFYQAADGQYIYLNAINIQMLSYEYKALEYAPPYITARIVDKDTKYMNEDLRKRFRYLQHLPLTRQFEMVELDLSPPLISKETLKEFAEQLENRRRYRSRRAREERRRERKIEVEEKKKWNYPARTTRLDSEYHFPQQGNLSVDNELASDPPEFVDTVDPTVDEKSSDNVTNNTSNSNTPSFAHMLRHGAPKPATAWPVAKSPSPPPTVQDDILSDEDESYSAPAPQYHLTLSEALAEALDRSEKSESTINPSSTDQSSKKKKKKKVKHTLLFTTSMARSNN